MSAKMPPSRVRRSKSEVQSDFEQIREKFVEEKQERTLKDEESALLREKEIREATQTLSAESVVQKIGAMELDISKALAGLSSQLLAESKQLQWLREAVSLEQQELGRLHKVDIAKTALEQLIQEYNEKQALLEKETQEARARWATEDDEKEKAIKLFDEELKRQRQRDKEEYEYDRDQEQKRAHAENEEKQKALEKSWAAREAALKEREDELSRLRQESAQFPERLKKEMDRAVAEAAKTLQAEHKQAFVVAQKDAETERRLAEQRIQSLEATVLRQADEIKSLTGRVEESKTQVQEIAIKAIESASGAKALSHINQIAMEQAKTRSSPQA